MKRCELVSERIRGNKGLGGPLIRCVLHEAGIDPGFVQMVSVRGSILPQHCEKPRGASRGFHCPGDIAGAAAEIAFQGIREKGEVEMRKLIREQHLVEPSAVGADAVIGDGA